MGNWHCVPNSCAQVIYQEYLPPSIRWRYEDEDWNKIEGDDYALEEKAAQCEGANYRMIYQEWRPNIKDLGGSLMKFCGRQLYRFGIFIGRITNWYITNNNGDLLDPEQLKLKVRFNVRETGFKLYIEHDNGRQTTKTFDGTYQLIEPIRFQPIGNNEDCIDCTLTISKNDRIVHQEIRGTCPQVEKLNCRLSKEQKVIEIKKIPFLERLEVVDYRYDVRLGYLNDNLEKYGFLLVRQNIPNECLNIYKNNITSTIPNNFFQIANTAENNYQLIAQICSAPGCSPPEYNVECDCDREECPPETCPLICGDRICCYDDYGKSIKEIPIDKYCGD